MIQVSEIGKSFKGNSILQQVSTSMLSPVKEVVAVSSVSFSCAPGTVLGLLGPNGAGKTTTLRMLSGALSPSKGAIKIKGASSASMNAAGRRSIGFLSGSTGLYARLTARENLAYFGRAYGIGKAALDKKIEELIASFGLQEHADKLVDNLSFGNKQRVAIARSVIHSPSILILDEPTTGLDVFGAGLVIDFIKAQREQGVAVIFSTHNMQEIESLCDKICIIASGTSRFEGTLDEAIATANAGSLLDAYRHIILQGKGN